jgi:hypothetical protein
VGTARGFGAGNWKIRSGVRVVVVKSDAMAGPLLWLEALAGFKALYDLVSGVPDYYASFKRHREESDTIEAARLASERYSTFSDKELRILIRKIEGCRDRFILQGSGKDRAQCLCSILNEIKDGNGGELPNVDAWHVMYAQLHCASAR